MTINATINAVNKNGDNGVVVSVTYSDGSTGNFPFTLPVINNDVKATIRAEVQRRNSIDAQIIDVAKLIGTVIGPV